MIDRTTLKVIEEQMRFVSYQHIKQITNRLDPCLLEPSGNIFHDFCQAIIEQYRHKSAFKVSRDVITNDIIANGSNINQEFGLVLRKILENQLLPIISKFTQENTQKVVNIQQMPANSIGPIKPTEEIVFSKSKSAFSQVSSSKNNALRGEGILGKFGENKFSENCANLSKKPQCLCDNLKEIRCKDESSFKCIHCNRLYHTVCMKKKSTSQFCCYCHLERMAPLKKTIKTLFVGLMKKTKKKHIANFYIPQIDASQKIQVRCLRLKESAQVSCLFPDVAEVSMNGQRCNMFEPINKQSCLKYRKDEPFNLLKGDFYKGQENTLVVSQNIQVNRQKDIRNDPQNHIIGLYIIEDVKMEQLINQIKLQNTLGFSQSLQSLQNSFGLGKDEEITCQLVKIPIQCPLTTIKIEIPVRGVYCNHFQCFDLKNYLTLISESQNPRWKCPLCPALAFDFKVDSIIQEIIKETKFNDQIKEILFFKNGDYSFIIDDEPLPERKNIRSLNIPEKKRIASLEPQPLEKPKKRPHFVIPQDKEVICLDD